MNCSSSVYRENLYCTVTVNWLQIFLLPGSLSVTISRTTPHLNVVIVRVFREIGQFNDVRFNTCWNGLLKYWSKFIILEELNNLFLNLRLCERASYFSCVFLKSGLFQCCCNFIKRCSVIQLQTFLVMFRRLTRIINILTISNDF